MDFRFLRTVDLLRKYRDKTEFNIIQVVKLQPSDIKVLARSVFRKFVSVIFAFLVVHIEKPFRTDTCISVGCVGCSYKTCMSFQRRNIALHLVINITLRFGLASADFL